MAYPAAYQAVGLKLVHEALQFQALFFGDDAGRIEPYQPDVAVLGENLFELRLYLVLKISGEGLVGQWTKIPAIPSAAGLVPILVL